MRRSLVLFCLVLPVFSLACGEPLTPEEELDRVRATFTAELQNFTIRETPVVTEAVVDGEEPAEVLLDADGEPILAEPEVDEEIILDILVSTDGTDALAGLTVDLTQVDKNQEEKASRRIFLEVGDVRRGIPGQKAVVLDDLDYVADDGFHVEVRSPIAAADRAAYREFPAH